MDVARREAVVASLKLYCRMLALSSTLDEPTPVGYADTYGAPPFVVARVIEVASRVGVVWMELEEPHRRVILMAYGEARTERVRLIQQPTGAGLPQ